MKYFSKSFFKFALGFLAIVLASLVVIFAVSAYASGVSKIAFTTDEQTISPGDVSGAITVQTQDTSGDSTPTPETIDLEFTSTSGTGEFLNSSGNPVTTTMSRNTSNRTFYYRDSREGTFTIKIVATGRDSGETWNADQKITVSSAESSGEVLSASSDTSSLSNSSTSGSAAPVYGSSISQLEVSAGGNRLTSTGSPITFQAFIKKNTASNSSVSFSWSFGDGNVGEGELVTHMYKYPGDYAVVLNARSGNTFAVSRLKVSVLSPKIELRDSGEYIEISNNSDSEINLFNWKIVSEGKGFIFQPDTIIFPNSSLILDKSLLKMKGQAEENIVLKNFLGQVVAGSESAKETVDMGKITKEIEEIRTQTVTLLSSAKGVDLASAQRDNALSGEGLKSEIGAVYNGEAKDATSTGNAEGGRIIFESPKEKGFLQKIKSFFASMLD